MEDKDRIKEELMNSPEAEDIMKLSFIMYGYEKEKQDMLKGHKKGEQK